MRKKPCVRNWSRKREGLYNGNVQQNPLCAASCDANSVLLLAHLCAAVLKTLYAQNPVFESVHDESVNVYPHMYNGNVQQNCLCVESCVAKEFSMSPRFSSTIFDPDANSVLLRAHLCTAVDSMRRKPCVRNCSRKREGLYNGNAQQNPLCAASCATKDIIHVSPRFSPAFFYRDANSVLLLAHLCTAVLIRSNEYIDPGIEHTPYRIFHVSPVLACVFLSRYTFSVLTSTPLYSSSLYAQKTLCSKLFKKA